MGHCRTKCLAANTILFNHLVGLMAVDTLPTIHSGNNGNGDPGGDEAAFTATPRSFWTNVRSRLTSVGDLTHFEVKTVSASLPPSEPFSTVLLKRTSAAVAMASFIWASVAPAAFAALV